ncbi:cytochrome C [Geomonas propionica]|uniref:Cytochrome C n=1 Tax=Geomonas propionica TaxID=2798582 RepID=A0ABS0YSK8_9BACT|nr:cytochrome C [Geomonas propionica]MBJ6800904.1 cytochrome C [Geomonas propionica]
MKLTGRDWLMAAGGMALIGLLALGSEKGRGKNVPLDERHKPLYDAMKTGRTQAATELVCATCHGQSSIPLPDKHPPKEQCLICHLFRAST